MVSVMGIDLALLLMVTGAGLIIAEAFAPGAHFIVLGIALLFAGVIGMALPESLGMFGVAILAVLVIGIGGLALYVYQRFDFYGGKGIARTSDSDSLTGEKGRVTKTVTETDGKVKLDNGGFNPNYQARAMNDEIPEGKEIIVVDPGGGNVLTVESIDTLSSDSIEEELERGRESIEQDQEQSQEDTDSSH